MDKILKTIACEIKDIDEEIRSFTAVASTEDLDRDNDRIMAAGWDMANFMKNPVVPWSHRYDDPPVARAEKVWVEGDRLMFRPRFAKAEDYPFADTIYKLYKGGFLKAFSVGFRAKRWERVDRGKAGRGVDFHEAELWEISACTVPSNPNALVEAKAAGIEIPADHLSILNRSEAIDTRLALEKRLDEMNLVAEKLNASLDRNEKVYERMDALIIKISSSLEAKPEKTVPSPGVGENPGDQTLETKDEEAETLDRDTLTDLAETIAIRSAEKIAEMVDKKINYHKGIV